MIIYALLFWIGMQLNASVWYNVLIGIGVFFNTLDYGLKMYRKGKNAQITSPIMRKEVSIMATWKQIEQRREARLWITQVILPTAGLITAVMMIPGVPEKIKSKAIEYKEKIETKFKKQG